LEVWLCNAHHVSNVPGRKTDVKDCDWLAQLMQCGLLRQSFVPPRSMRDLRDLTRTRACLEDDKTRVANRIHKVLEDANIKLSVVASDILGVSGRAMLQKIIDGQTDPQDLALLAKGRLKRKKAQLAKALNGYVCEHHRFMLRLEFEQLRSLEGMVSVVDGRIAQVMAQADASQAKEQADEVQSLKKKEEKPALPFLEAMQKLIAISAGRNKSGATTKGNNWLRRALCQAAWAASRAKKSSLSGMFRRLVRRRGPQRAIIAVGHSLLVSIYHMLKKHVEYKDLGPDYYAKLNKTGERKMIRHLEKLGYKITPAQAA
jgi:transposase